MLMKDKVCVVTGAAASGGIGWSTACLFAAHGARVIVIDVSNGVDVSRVRSERVTLIQPQSGSDATWHRG